MLKIAVMIMITVLMNKAATQPLTNRKDNLLRHSHSTKGTDVTHPVLTPG